MGQGEVVRVSEAQMRNEAGAPGPRKVQGSLRGARQGFILVKMN